MTLDPIAQLCTIAMRGHVQGLFTSLVLLGEPYDNSEITCCTIRFPQPAPNLWQLMTNSSKLADTIHTAIDTMKARHIACEFHLIQPLPIYDKCAAYPLLGLFPDDMDDMAIFHDTWRFRLDYFNAPKCPRPRRDCFAWIVCEAHHDARVKLRSISTWLFNTFSNFQRGRP